MLIEDLYIIDDHKLIYSGGDQYITLNRVERASYEIDPSGNKLVLSDAEGLILSDSYLRLGNINTNGDIVYSKRGVGILGSTCKIHSLTAHQPFQHKHRTYYTELTHKTDGPLWEGGSDLADSICCNNELVFDIHSLNESFDDNPYYIEMGNPYVVENIMLFEANKNLGSPQTWEILSYDLDSGKFQHLLDNAANPAYYKGTMFYCSWKDHRFYNLAIELEI